MRLKLFATGLTLVLSVAGFKSDKATDQNKFSHGSIVRRVAVSPSSALSDLSRLSQLTQPSPEIKAINTAGDFAIPPKGISFSATTAFERFLTKDGVAKIIFFAGVEGSGHHLLEQLSFLSRVPYRQLHLRPKTWQCGGEWHKSELKTFIDQLKTLDHNSIHVLPQQLSYPSCFIGGHEGRMSYDYPRLDWILEAVRQVSGVQLHVLQLHRDLGACLAADCIHRHWEHCSQQVEILAVNGAKLAAHLRLLDPSERTCFPFGDMEGMEKAVTETFGAQYEHLVKEVFQGKVPPRANHTPNVQDLQRWPDYVSSLQETQKSLDDVCEQSHKVNLSSFVRTSPKRVEVVEAHATS